MTNHEERYAEKIRGLLAKAESTTPEEAEACVAKAQELMTKYAISEALLDKLEGRNTDEIEQREVILVGLFQGVTMDITCAVARANNCKPVYTNSADWSSRVEVNGKLYKQWIKLTLTGFRTDLERVLMLDSSLQIQCSRAMRDWYRENKQSWWTKGQDHRERKQFIRGFAQAVTQRLNEANRVARAEAAQDEAKRSGGTEESGVESVELVLRDRKDRVEDWFDKQYGGHLRTVTRNYTPGSMSAGNAGRAAGARADLGQAKVGSQRSLGRSS